MQKTLLVAALGLSVVCAAANADDLAMPQTPAPQNAETTMPGTAPANVILPRKGQDMAEVAKEFGQPKLKHGAVGGSTPQQPPITRWDYPDFSVFFERSHVIDAVVPGQPPKIYHKDELKPAP
ncbi:MAG: hypothetical protein ACRETM_06045 [Stenotrophobium sp.]